MNDSPMHFALRQLRTVFTTPIALAIMVGVGVIAGITGPFSTFEHFAPAPRLAYWVIVVLTSYGAGTIGVALVQHLLLGTPRPLAVRILVLGLGASVPATAAVVLVSALFFPDLRQTGLSLVELYVYCLLISLALMAVLEGVVDPWLAARHGAGERPHAAQPPKLLERLPAEKRGRLSHMSMADHYVEIHTDRGMALVLMRLPDAIAETDGIVGMRIHRSHWVARDAVAGLKRVDGRAVVELSSGRTLPVSRSYLPAVRAALE